MSNSSTPKHSSCSNKYNPPPLLFWLHDLFQLIQNSGALTMPGRKLGRMDFATKVFDRMLVRTHIFWNTMVSGFSLSYDCDFTSKIFRRMKLEGFEPCEAQGMSEYHY
ncbi:hypothetical protein POM88_012985 [Heracleum sosnowskyi]|uniref:Pentatricopeptide repeat-containing protein n=1 Tax=Heracleum sosnowskyi TaxID=360622 RepID=A0AAD8IZ55_9APIA|nr:hypothetical protein POM88_012985 [Heracleum sosnowskyi]